MTNEDQANGDDDAIGAACDNCPDVTNASQTDADSDTVGDACDNCPADGNSDQADGDDDGVGNVCDNCPSDGNTNQADADGDSVGDVCDNCPADANQDQLNGDDDSHGNACDNCPLDTNEDQADADGDSVGSVCDNCPVHFNTDQADGDSDTVGNPCDNCPLNSNGGQEDGDGDDVGNVCDNCPGDTNADQTDTDSDGDGDVCDTDDDGDGDPDSTDCAPLDPSINQFADEACGDGLDNNCDGATDEGCWIIFSYEPSNFDPDVLDPVVAPVVTLDCPAEFYSGSPVAFVEWCGQSEPLVEIDTAPDADVVILTFQALTITDTGSLTITGDRPVILAVFGDATIDGSVDASASGGTAGPGGDTVCTVGDGSPGGNSNSDNDGAGGGGGGGFGTSGASGGSAQTGSGGGGGSSEGNASLVPLRGGCSGGQGGRGAGSNAPGGGGGGAVQISASATLFIGSTGVISAGGGGGQVGGDAADGGAGGGSGGGILIEGGSVDLASGAWITANGAGGGGGEGEYSSGGSHSGSDGDPTTTGCSDGGACVGTQCGDGGDGEGVSCSSQNGGAGDDGGGGGGGGGLGRVRVNSPIFCPLAGTISAVYSTNGCKPPIFVDGAAGGDNNGSTWEHAYTSLSTAISNAFTGDQIWVKEGTYSSTPYSLKDGVFIYGGFDSALSDTSGSVAGRDLLNDVTVINGGGTTRCLTPVDNGHLDGFTLQNGFDGTEGGAMHLSGDTGVVFRNCVFTGNNTSGDSGGGAVRIEGYSEALFEDCTFNDNTTTSSGGDGGAVSIYQGTALFNDCVFIDNSAGDLGGAVYSDNAASNATFNRCILDGNTSVDRGGGLAHQNGTSVLNNCVIANNRTTGGGSDGGGVHSYGGSVTLTNCTIAYNHATDDGGAVIRLGGTVILVNSIVWGNTNGTEAAYAQFYGTVNVSYSVVEGGYSGTGNSDEYPVFKLTGEHPYELCGVSDAVDSANTAAANYPATDLLGTARYDEPAAPNSGGGYADMGAYEWDGTCTKPDIDIFVDNAASGDDDGTSWEDAYTSLTAAISAAGSGYTIGVKEGTYTSGSDPAFGLKSFVKIYGGFDSALTGTEGTIAGRDLASDVTIIDGQDSNRRCLGPADDGHLDGFTVQNCGNRTDEGAVMFVNDNNITLQNCIFKDANGLTGGALHVETSGAGLTIIDCTFDGSNPLGGYEGGAIYTHTTLDLQGVTFKNNKGTYGGALRDLGNPGSTCDGCVFENNAGTGEGGAIYTTYDTVHTNSRYENNSALNGGAVTAVNEFSCTNCLFAGNTATATYGGGVYYAPGSTFTNCTFVGNSADDYGGGMRTLGAATIVNSILWGNTAPTGPQVSSTAASDINYTDVQGGWGSGAGNINSDPLFVTGPDGDYYLSEDAVAGQSSDSPCINAANDTAANLGLDTKTTRTDGVVDTGTADLGYHYQP